MCICPGPPAFDIDNNNIKYILQDVNEFLGFCSAKKAENLPVDFVKDAREIFFDIEAESCYTVIAI